MSETEQPTITAGAELRAAPPGSSGYARHRAVLAGMTLPELVAATRAHYAAMYANLSDEPGGIDDDAVDHGCGMDAGLVALVADRQSVTLADLAAKAALAEDRFAGANCMTAQEMALLMGILADARRFAEVAA